MVSTQHLWLWQHNVASFAMTQSWQVRETLWRQFKRWASVLPWWTTRTENPEDILTKGEIFVCDIADVIISTEAKVQSKTSLCGICCGQLVTGTGFCLSSLNFSSVKSSVINCMSFWQLIASLNNTSKKSGHLWSWDWLHIKCLLIRLILCIYSVCYFGFL